MNQSTNNTEKVHKVLARAGLGSRREIEEWIRGGRIRINERLAQIGDRVDDHSVIRLDGKQVHLKPMKEIRRRVLIYNKPVGEICTHSDPQGRTTVFENLPNVYHGRWLSIGRLDINTSGLIMFTNDGELANRMMHPSAEIERHYAVRIHGEPTQQQLQQLKKGVELDDGMASFDSIKAGGGQGTNNWFTVSLKEGRNREVRRLWQALDLEVSRLIRIKYGVIELPKSLSRGVWSELDDAKVNELAESVGLKATNIVKRSAPNKHLRHKRMVSKRRRYSRNPKYNR